MTPTPTPPTPPSPPPPPRTEHRRKVLPEPTLPDPKRADRALPKADLLVRKLIREEQRDRARAERERVAELNRPDAGMIHGGDMGVGLAIERGIVEVNKDDHVPLDPDSKRSLVRIMARARKVWVPDRLLAAHTIEQHQHDAASRFYDDFLIGVEGARRGPKGGTRLDPWNRCIYSEQRAMRRQSFQMARRAIGPELEGVLVWCVLQLTPQPDIAPTIEKWAGCFDPPWPVARATGFLAGALEALAAHYGYSRASHPTKDRERREKARRGRIGAPSGR